MKLTFHFSLIFFSLLIIPYESYSQNTGPAAPEYSSFEPVDAKDMVNLISGDMTYTLPIFNVPGPDGGYPLALSYHAGITTEQEASWVGLGWSLNAGAINRTVRMFPDDSKVERSFSINHAPTAEDIYHEFDISYGISAGEYGTGSVGISIGWWQYQTFGGEVSIGGKASFWGFGVQVSNMGTYENSVGFYFNPLEFATSLIGAKLKNMDPNSPGFEAAVSKYSKLYDYNNVFTPSLGVNVDMSGVNYSASFSSCGISLGVSYSSATNTANSYIAHNYGGFSSNSVSTPHFTGTMNAMHFYLPLNSFSPLPNIGYTSQQVKRWLFDMRNKQGFGALYPYESDQLSDWHQDKDIAFDSYIVAYDEENYLNGNQIETANSLSFPAYDAYSVSAQGLQGSISPRIFDWGSMPRHSFIDDLTSEGETQKELVYLILKNFDDNKIHYYFDNELVSYIDMEQYLFDWDVSTSDEPSNEITENNKPNLTTTNSAGSSFFNNGRKGAARHIEYFSNEEIVTDYSDGSFSISENTITKGFIEYEGLKGNRDSDETIGAYSITAIDGKTYHFSLPVYQYEQFSIIEETANKDREDKVFSEDRTLDRYAYTWLLTAITGPDYVDRGEIGVIDNEDWGYWVKFDYGKWSDGYIWRSPYTGYLGQKDGNGLYAFGRKEIYYLDAIHTRSHTALFIKSIREDGKGAPNNELLKTERYTSHPNWWDTDCSAWNFFCHTREAIVNTFMRIDGNDMFGIIKQVDQIQEVNLKSQHSTLRLDNVLIIENDCLDKISKSGGDNPAPHFGYLNLHEERLLGDMGNQNNHWSEEHFRAYSSGTIYSEVFDNVYDISDLEAAAIEDSEILRQINLGYDYSLIEGAQNATNGKLTLKRVDILGENKLNYMPPYIFEYTLNENSNDYYASDISDDWGYNKFDAATWSLKEITTPVGTKVTFEYEQDSFNYEGVFGGTRTVINKSADALEGYSGNILDFILDIPNDLISHLNDPNLKFEFFGDLTANYKLLNTVKKTSELRNKIVNLISIDDANNTITLQLEADDIDHWVFEEPISITNSKLIIYGINRNKKGGGVRVKAINLVENNQIKNRISYDYFNGSTSYAMIENDPDYIPYKSELPAPYVLYKDVTVSHFDAYGNKMISTDYKFNTFGVPAKTDTEESFGDLLFIKEHQHEQGTGEFHEQGTFHVDSKTIPFFDDPNGRRNHFYARSATLIDNTAALGRLISVKSKNDIGDIITEKNYEYYEKGEVEIGITKETFLDSKIYTKFTDDSRLDVDVDFYFTTSSRKKYPNILKSIESKSGQFSSTIYTGHNDLSDFGFNIKSGMNIYSQSIIEDGSIIEHFTLPAFTVDGYQGNNTTIGMGSKLQNPQNKNMLTQQAASITKKNGKVIDVGIQTWKGDWDNYLEWNTTEGLYETTSSDPTNIWRKHKSFVWNGDLDTNGNYATDITMADLEANWATYFSGEGSGDWQKTSEIVRYDHYSVPVEVTDINGDFAATKKDPENITTVATAANARHSQFAHCGFEYGPYTNNQGEAGVFVPYNTVTHKEEHPVHTGNYCKLVGYSKTGASYRIALAELNEWNWSAPVTFNVSVWLYKEANALPSPVNDNTLLYGNGEGSEVTTFRAGNWVRYSRNFTFTEKPTEAISFSVSNYISEGKSIYIDDFRVSPYEAAVTAYTYDNVGNVTAIMNNDNFATKYEYDEAGRLRATYIEKPSGFELVSSTDYGYARNLIIPHLHTSANSLSFKSLGQSVLLTINSNVPWTATITNQSSSGEWVTQDIFSGEGDGIITLTCEPLGAILRRSATLEIRGEGLPVKYIPLSQESWQLQNECEQGYIWDSKLGECVLDEFLLE
jgi:YD repeat-containing protein